MAAASEGALEGVRAVVRLMVGAGAAVLLVLSIMAAFAEIQIRGALTLAASGDLAAAQSHFHTAQSLRAWDAAVAATAGHAFVVVIAQSDQGDQQRLATNLAAVGWVSKARARIPDSEQVALDEASVRELRGHYRAAAGLLRGTFWPATPSTQPSFCVSGLSRARTGNSRRPPRYSLGGRPHDRQPGPLDRPGHRLPTRR